jgi:hypothetical protein
VNRFGSFVLVLAPSLGALIYSTRHTLLSLVCLGGGIVAAALVLASECGGGGRATRAAQVVGDTIRP